MSLIDDALRRAQAAQAGTAADGRGLRVPMPLPDSGRSRRRRMFRLALGILAVGVVAAGGVFLLRGRRSASTADDAAPAPSSSSSAAAAAPAASTRTPTATATPTPAGSTVPQAAPAVPSILAATPTRAPAAPMSAAPSADAPSLTAAPEAVAPTPRRALIRREPPLTPVILPPAEVSAASASPRVANEDRRAGMEPTRQPSRPKTYQGTANLPSARLELEGIVYSEGSPMALINGRVVAPGGYVEGYTVVRIERDRVELKGDDGSIILTLK